MDGKFYLGRLFDPQQGKVTDQPYLYDPDDLTTHGVVVGMTGSGKTGLCIGLLEEAALHHIPALMIDPKGDITNALLHFPELLPQDFQPWINPDEARRAGQTLEQAAAEAAASWQKGLASWGISTEQLRALQDSVHFAVYTPGSDSGIPVSILSSLKAPDISWENNREMLREKISGTVTALLGLVGMANLDPVRSREHILLSNIFEHAWRQGHDLDLAELILQTQNPPFTKLGVFDVNTFFPEKERFELAMLLNNILAAPAFQAWIEGQPLDIPSLLFAPDGRPRHSVFYIAHLTEPERMFFVTLLYSAVESWMRAQSGTSSLRAILYFDEIFGYLPPVSNPASKPVMLRMLKQARAFGVGQVLVTQNPVDLDYKALSNAGTWMIGKLQTEQDKQRLLDGLEGVMAGQMDRGQYDRLISSLGKRVFLAQNVHRSGPALFQTRWAMNYLAGPLTRTQLPALNKMVGALPPAVGQMQQELAAPTTSSAPATIKSEPVTRPQSAKSQQPVRTTSTTRPTVPAGLSEYFLPNNLSLAQAFKVAGRSYPAEAHSQRGILYKPAVLAQVSIRFLNRKYNLDYELRRTALVDAPDQRGIVRWENYLVSSFDPHQLDDKPIPQTSFTLLEMPLTDAKALAALQKDFLDWANRTSQVVVRANEALKVYVGPEVSSADFSKRCAEATRKGRDAEIKKVSTPFNNKIKALQDKLTREERELVKDQAELSQRKTEQLGTDIENVLGLFGGRKSSRRITTSLSKRRMTEQAKAEVEESVQAIADFKKQIAALESEKAQAIEEINNRWSDIANQTSEIPIVPLKKDVLLDLFGVAWFPYYQVEVGQELIDLSGFKAS